MRNVTKTTNTKAADVSQHPLLDISLLTLR
nr:MAG TPA: hypothetical protein [Caudoviricetes sp.]